MSPRCFFDLTNGRILLRDHDGVDYKSFDQALEQAIFVIDEMGAEEVLPGADADWELLIRDENGVVHQCIMIMENGMRN